MNEIAYIVKFAVWLGKAIGSSKDLFSSFDAESLGTKLPDTVINANAVQSALQHAASNAQAMEEAAEALEIAGNGNDNAAIIAAFVEYGTAMVQYFSILKDVVDAIASSINSSTISDPSERASAEDLVDDLIRKLTDFTIISVVEQFVPVAMLVLKVLGLAEWESASAKDDNNVSRDYVKRKLHFERLKDLFSDPVQHFKNAHGWGEESFDPQVFFEIYQSFFDEEDDIEIGVEDGEPFIRHGAVIVRRDGDISPPGLLIGLHEAYDKERNFRIEINDQWGIGLDTNLSFEGDLSASVTPPLNVKMNPVSGEVKGALKAYLNRNESARPFHLIGGSSLIDFTVEDTKVGFGLDATWDIQDNSASINPLLFIDITGGVIKIGGSESDGFISKLLSNSDIEGNFDLGLEWQGDTGLRIKASGGIEIALPVHVNLGIIEINTLYIVISIDEDGTISLETSSAFKGNLGVLKASVERLGAETNISFANGDEGKYGLFDLNLDFKPPNGVGLSLDAGIIKGGGYLFLDFDKGEYAGALEFTFSEIVSLKAIGIITTKMPDGSNGFSMLIIITAEFGAGIQLGFGFKLMGVGGLMGLNRTMKLEKIAQGVRDGGINSIMFPQDVVANAQKIISDLKTYFPVEEGKFLIGPMAKIGWGTPTLISVSLGIIIEIPGNIAILGVIKIALPDEDAALLILQVNFMGAIEFDKQRLWFFASLFGSRVLFITIDGEMGLLIAWGNNAEFVSSIGGFHPVFNPPALPFPNPVRLSFNILNESWGKVRVMGYFAVTSNTVQFGARVEIYFGFKILSVEGHIGFDALFQFSPFYFIISISASFSVKVFGAGLFSVKVKMSLEGPTPWRAKGTGSISILFWDIEVDFDKTWGDKKDTSLPPVTVMPLIKAEYDKLENWKAELPAGNNLLVTLRQLESEEELVLHPVGTLKISQRAIPLDITLDKVGAQKPSDANKFHLNTEGSNVDKVSNLKENFPLAQFQEMDDSKKLSRPSFEKENSGVEMAVKDTSTAIGKAVKRVVRYETIIIDNYFKRVVIRFFEFFNALFPHFFNNNAVARSPLSNRSRKRMNPYSETIQVKSNAFSVANLADNKAFSEEAMTFESEALAQEYVKNVVAGDPNMADSLHVIPQSELNTAA